MACISREASRWETLMSTLASCMHGTHVRVSGWRASVFERCRSMRGQRAADLDVCLADVKVALAIEMISHGALQVVRLAFKRL